MIVLTWQDVTGQTVDVQFDVVTTESYEAVMAITAHPVEKGAPVVDHARPEPVKLSIEGFVSNSPLPSNMVREPGVMAALASELRYPPDQRHPIGSTALEYPPGPGPNISYHGAVSAISAGIDSLLGGGLPDHVDPTQRAIAQLPKTVTAFRAVAEMPDRARDVFEKLEAARKSRALVMVSTRYTSIQNMLIEHLSVDRSVESAGGLPFQMELTQVRIVESQVVAYPTPSQPRAAKEVNKGSQQAESFLWQAGNTLGAWP